MSHPRETLGFTRLMLVISGLAPLYILWALRGIPLIGDFWLCGFAGCVIATSYGVLGWRIYRSRKNRDLKDLVITEITDHREHLLIYLVAILLPLFDANLDTMRQVLAVFAAFAFIVFIFLHMNLHYINPLFALCGYHVYSFQPTDESSQRLILITRRLAPKNGTALRALRLSNTVFFDDSI